MKTFQKNLLMLALVPMLFLVSCKDDDEPIPADDPFATMTAYMVDNGMDIPDVINGWITGAPSSLTDVTAFVDSYYIMDLRAADAFAAGHIEGAVNTTYGTLLADAQNATKPILIVCYTGQSAGHAVMALRLSGFADAKVLKWGMSGWSSLTQGPWAGSIGDAAIGHSSWTMGPVAETTTFEAPTFETTATEGAEILAERVEFMLANGFSGVNSTDVLAAPDNFFVNNYWAATDTEHYGHIAGAVRIQPLTIANEEFLFLDPDKPVVSYCWTGQTSSMLTSYLTILGYDAKSLKFGANGMIYDDLESHKYSPPSVDLPVVTE